MSNDVRVILVVLSQVICIIVCGCDYRPHCLLSLLRLIFKTYKYPIPSMFLFHMCLLYNRYKTCSVGVVKKEFLEDFLDDSLMKNLVLMY